MSTTPGELTKEIAGVIKGQMSRFNISQGEMATHVGVDQSQLSKMIRGLKPITIDHLEIMCIVSGLDIEKVMDDAASAIANRMDWPDVPALVIEGVRVSSRVDDEPTPDFNEPEARKSDQGLAAKEAKRKADS